MTSVISRLWGGKKQPTPREQLRTPSPSVEAQSVATGPPRSPQVSSRSESPTRPAIVQPPPPTPQALLEQLKSIPPQTLHQYFKDQLPLATPSELLHLESFLHALTPPPRLHCVRCHKNYFELENTHLSCLVPHDDESAEVEHIGLIKTAKGGKVASYETHWNCCDKTVDGDGDLGPPDGWCYEGKHTTDRKRAKFRYDVTSSDDRLQSCDELRCGQTRRSSRRSGAGDGHVSDGTRAASPAKSVTFEEPKKRTTRRKRRSEPEDEDAGHKSDTKTGAGEEVKKQRKKRRVS